MANLSIYYRAYGYYNHGVRWNSGADPLVYDIDSERWYRLNTPQLRDDFLARYTMLNFPEVESIDHIAIEETKQL